MTQDLASSRARCHTISVVIPVYGGRTTLAGLVEELLPLTGLQRTPDGRPFLVHEVLLVDDNGPDGSDEVIRELAARHEAVRPVWLSRNFGQHAATLAGMASSGGDWVVTMDEDGQHDPGHLGSMLDVAMAQQADVVYAKATNEPPHGALRNAASVGAKRIVAALSPGAPSGSFHSFRLMLGEVARSVAAYAGPGIYLDVALHWVARRTAQCPVPMRAEQRASGYDLRSLTSHFWRLVLSSGTKPLRWVSYTGISFAVLAVVATLLLITGRIVQAWNVPGWSSTLVILLFCTGVILFCLGVIAEYVGVAVNMAMGKPLYLLTRDRAQGPLGRDR